MDLYGNILTLYNASQGDIDQVKIVISGYDFPFEIIENTFFIGTSSIKKSETLQSQLLTMNLEFTFLFLFNSDGSTLKGKNINEDTLSRINDILLGD